MGFCHPEPKAKDLARDQGAISLHGVKFLTAHRTAQDELRDNRPNHGTSDITVM